MCTGAADVPAVTLSRRPGTAPQPRATLTSQGTVEAFRNVGIEDRGRAAYRSRP
ncbi:MAG TPA: FAD-dependent monooxygenase [Pseudonocardiaceae bacterium]|nr:FAD-dependent monooxygenase [Pseudonocardiaceae bacterium]